MNDSVDICRSCREMEERIKELEQALLPFALAFEYAGVAHYKDILSKPDGFKGFLDRNSVTPNKGIFVKQYRIAWETMNKLRVEDLLPPQPEDSGN